MFLNKLKKNFIYNIIYLLEKIFNIKKLFSSIDSSHFSS